MADESSSLADDNATVAGGLLTITFEDGSSVILSRQIATREVWVAARSGGFHLAMVDGQWHCGTTDEDLGVLLDRVFTEHAGESVAAFGEL